MKKITFDGTTIIEIADDAAVPAGASLVMENPAPVVEKTIMDIVRERQAKAWYRPTDAVFKLGAADINKKMKLAHLPGFNNKPEIKLIIEDQTFKLKKETALWLAGRDLNKVQIIPNTLLLRTWAPTEVGAANGMKWDSARVEFEYDVLD